MHSLVQIVEKRSLVISKSSVHASIIVTFFWFVSRVLGAKVGDLDATSLGKSTDNTQFRVSDVMQ